MSYEMNTVNKNKYRRDLTKYIHTHIEKNLLVIDGADFLPQSMSYTDDISVKTLATSAVHTADGFYELVNSNCNVKNPDISMDAHLEMYLALSGLACEIYMKSIIYNEKIHNGKLVREHKLDILFDMLPRGTQLTIIQKINDIQTILPTIRDIFTTLRYDFELSHINGEYLVIFQLMEELRTICHSYPQEKVGTVAYANGVLSIE